MPDHRSGKIRPTPRERLEYAAIAAILWFLRLFPYRWRVPLAGWVIARVVAPLTGMRRRIRANLGLVCPDLSPAERRAIERGVPDNFGRMFAEMFSPGDFMAVVAATPLAGPGLPDLRRAQAEGRPIVAVSGHFGNYDIGRARLIHEGLNVGGLYRPMNNRLFNRIYVHAIACVGGPLFIRDKGGFGQMLRHLRAGNTVAILLDQHIGSGARLRFFGHPARTALSAAQMALRYDALLIPIYAIRQPDGISFRIEVEQPIPPSDELSMTQAINDSLEAQVRRHMDQWLWIHRRWKDRGGAT